MELIRCETFRAKISPETCRVRKEKAARPRAQDYINESNYSFLQCLDCKPEGKRRVEVDVGKIDTGQKEPVCGGCGKKASEVYKFNYKAGICNACWQKDYRKEKGPRIRKISKECKGEYPTFPPRGGEPEIVPQKKERKVTIDFFEHPDLFERLIKVAETEIRSLDNLIIYFLTRGDFSNLNAAIN